MIKTASSNINMANKMDTNEYLSKLHGDAFCSKCGRKYPEVILNIESQIHHGRSPVCLDTKNCERFKRGKSK